MPYKSAKQERWAHTEAAKKAGFPTAEFDAASKGKKLPESAHHVKHENHAKHEGKMNHHHHGG